MSHKSLTDREQRIVNLLKKDSYGFNELYYALSGYTSRPTLRKDLHNLVNMQLVHERKGRRGQKTLYMLTETLTRFEAKERSLEMMWEDLFCKLNQLKRCVEDGILDPEDAGSMLVWLVFDALPLLAIGLIGVKSFSFDARRRLYGVSVEKFNNYWENILRLGHKHPKISQGFQKGCKDLNAAVKPVVEEIEGWFKQLAELKQHEGK
jgi:hypothetical protein